jgi:hypothetical protein
MEEFFLFVGARMKLRLGFFSNAATLRPPLKYDKRLAWTTQFGPLGLVNL